MEGGGEMTWDKDLFFNAFVSERNVSWGNFIPKMIHLFPRLVAKLY